VQQRVPREFIVILCPYLLPRGIKRTLEIRAGTHRRSKLTLKLLIISSRHVPIRNNVARLSSVDCARNVLKLDSLPSDDPLQNDE